MPTSAAHPAPSTGRHHLVVTPRMRVRATLDVLGRLGGLVTLAALLVVGTAAGAATSVGEPDRPVVTVTWGHSQP